MRGRWLLPLLFVGAMTADAATQTARAVRTLTRLAGEAGPNERLAVTELSLDVGGQSVPARIYASVDAPASAPGIVLCHGIHRLGIDEPRLGRFSRALAASGLVVLTPRIEALTDYRIDAASVPTIDVATRTLASRLGRPRVGLMGFSFAGGLALVAASNPATSRGIGVVVAVGAHDDLGRVTRFFADGATTTPDGRSVTMRPHEYGPLVVAYGSAERFFSAEDVPRARDVMRLRLWERGGDADRLAKGLSEAGQHRFGELIAGDRAALAPLIAKVTEERAQDFRAASPHGKLGGIRVPVYLLHGSGDSVIPPTETAWLASEVPATQLRDALVSPIIQHVEIHGEPSWRERGAVVRFLARILGELETT